MLKLTRSLFMLTFYLVGRLVASETYAMTGCYLLLEFCSRQQLNLNFLIHNLG